METVQHANFFDSRDKYLSFVHTTDEKIKTAFYLANHIGEPPPRRPFFVLDAGAGEGTVISTFLTALHKQIPRAPIVVVGKEISIDDICILLGYLPDRFAEHKSLVFHIVNLTYDEMDSPGKFLHMHKVLEGDTSRDFGLQLMNMSAFVKKHWALQTDDGGVLRPQQKIALSIYRQDQQLALAKLLSLPRRFDFIIASQPFRLRRALDKTAALIIAPLLRMLKSDGRMILIYSSGRDFSRALLRFLYPQVAPYQNSSPRRLLRAIGKIPECATKAAAARVSSFRYGFINMYLGRKHFSLGSVFSLWKAVTYVGQISESEQRAVKFDEAMADAIRRKMARVRDKNFVNHVIHFGGGDDSSAKS